MVLASRLLAQAVEPSPQLLGATEVHCGVSTQSLVYFGARQFVSDQFFGEVGIGSIPKFEEDMRPLYTSSVGIGYTPQDTRTSGNGMFFSLLYSYLSENTYLTSDRDYIHAGTVNIGFVHQQKNGWSIMTRFGLGVLQFNDYVYQTVRYIRAPDPGSWPDDYERQLYPWANLEFAVGFAF